ncbi:MAG: hypothetical protein Q8L29_00275 [archaeon]|nr:hypothetical protein [archaeon]
MNKKAAIELSIGTIVVIVLAMSMLILGLVLVKTIFTGATESVTAIDSGVKNEISKLFNENADKRLVLYPDSKIIKLKQGSSGEGFALAIKNIEQGSGSSSFGYNINYDSQTNNCGSGSPLTSWAKIDVGQSLSGIPLANGNSMADPVHVRFTIGNTAPICTFRLTVSVTKDGAAYEVGFMDVQIISK